MDYPTSVVSHDGHGEDAAGVPESSCDHVTPEVCEGAPSWEIRTDRRGLNPATLQSCDDFTLSNATMDPPRFLLEALEESITSGTFIDTKFYVFSRRDSSGRVSSPRPLYCNSRVLNTVPYFSSREPLKHVSTLDV